MLTNTVTPFAWGATGATNTTVRATLSPNTSTTSTANLTAIQNAINSASTAGGGIVRLNAGTYTINGGRIRMRTGVRLEGPARTANNTTLPTAILKAGTGFLTAPQNGGVSMLISYEDGLSNMTVANVLVDMNESAFTTSQLTESLRRSAFAVDFRWATNVVLDGVFVKSAFNYNAYFDSSTKVGVRNCNLLATSIGRWDQVGGVHLQNVTKADVVDNMIDLAAGGVTADGDDAIVLRTAWFGTPTADVNVRNNRVRAGRSGASLRIVPDSGTVSNLNIENNLFEGGFTTLGIVVSNGDESVSNVKIGGAEGKGNTFVDLTAYSVDLTQGGGQQTNCVATYNYTERSGPFTISNGAGNVVANNNPLAVPDTRTVSGLAAAWATASSTTATARRTSRTAQAGLRATSATGTVRTNAGTATAKATAAGNVGTNSYTTGTATARASAASTSRKFLALLSSAMASAGTTSATRTTRASTGTAVAGAAATATASSVPGLSRTVAATATATARASGTTGGDRTALATGTAQATAGSETSAVRSIEATGTAYASASAISDQAGPPDDYTLIIGAPVGNPFPVCSLTGNTLAWAAPHGHPFEVLPVVADQPAP